MTSSTKATILTIVTPRRPTIPTAEASTRPTRDETDTANDGWSDNEPSSNASFSESAVSSPSYGYHDNGTFSLSGPDDVGDVSGNEGETDTETDTYGWTEQENVSGSNPYHMNEGGGDSVSVSFAKATAGRTTPPAAAACGLAVFAATPGALFINR